MVDRFISWLTPPRFPGDELKTRQASLVHIAVQITFGLNVIAIGAALLGSRLPPSINLICAVLLVFCLVINLLMRRGYVRAASVSILLLGLIGTIAAVAAIGTIRAPGAAVFVLLVITAGLLFERPGLIGSIALCSLAILGLIAAETAGLLPRPDYTVNLTQWLTFTMLLAAAGLLTRLALRTTRRALQQAEQELADRIAAEAALHASEEKFRMMAENSVDIIWHLDRHYCFDYVSPADERVRGFPQAEVLGTPLWQWLTPDGSDYIKRMNARRLADEAGGIKTSTCQYELELRCKDGRWIWAEISVTAHHTPTGELIGYHGVSRDITERKHAEAALRELNATLEQRVAERTAELRQVLATEQELGQIKSRFIAMASHDFRTPLTGILTSAELLENYGPRLSDDKKLAYLQRIQTGVKHMTQLLDDVLDIERAEAGKLTCVPAPLDLVAVSRVLLDEAQITATPQHTVEFAHQGDFTGAQLDEKLLRRILINLIGNALKYSPAGGPVRLSLHRDQAHAVFTVSDRGLGIPPEAQRHLYEPFYRAHNVGETPGTGLGLPIVKQAVDAHHGTIEVSSTLGVGTTFIIKLPVCPPISEQLPS
ncbi:MAG: PAS domain S-box protein [Thermoflexales bacterium]|nr:PAS domain S-box protein [Thermoflexales bacterium]